MPKVNLKRRLTLAALTVGGLGVTAFTVITLKDQTYVPSADYVPVDNSNSKVAVVYYSRSGHSEAVAREIARTYNASITKIDADYPRSLSGQGKAISDARAKALPQITVASGDFNTANRVFLLSPIWMFRPATPLWAYVEQADLTNKEVVLITTGNSRFEQSEIDAFARRIETRGGRLIRHIFLRRGRIYWQKSREELLKEIRAEMEQFR